MINVTQIKNKFTGHFEEHQASILAEVITETIHESQKELVKASDFNELKEIVKEIGVKVSELAEAQKELAEAQKRTEHKVVELAEAQKRTELEIKELAGQTGAIKIQLSGLSKSMGYALENEAYRVLPGYLKNLVGLEITEKFVRKVIDGEEINIFGKGKKNGQDVIIVGEAELRLTSVGKKIGQLERKVSLVQKKYPQKEICKLLIAHFARPEAIKKAEEKGVIVIQSFEWL